MGLVAISIQDRHEDGEERWQTIGRIGRTVVLLVAHTYRDGEPNEEIVRIISARKATPKERRIYEQDDR
ncbi:BrnT family toxin [Candidatus Thiosymbion oneisti]|uniref:BrnT family toxin n=1 Tax=Candidatus Thiosymbion oneisti TaxID=589554 RepID=UPI000A896409